MHAPPENEINTAFVRPIYRMNSRRTIVCRRRRAAISPAGCAARLTWEIPGYSLGRSGGRPAQENKGENHDADAKSRVRDPCRAPPLQNAACQPRRHGPDRCTRAFSHRPRRRNPDLRGRGVLAKAAAEQLDHRSGRRHHGRLAGAHLDDPSAALAHGRRERRLAEPAALEMLRVGAASPGIRRRRQSAAFLGWARRGL